MLHIKGFCKIAALYNNARGVTRNLGEMTSIMSTYSNDIVLYQKEASSTEINIYHVKNELGVRQDSDYSEAAGVELVELTDYIYHRAIAKGDASVDSAALVDDLISVKSDQYSTFAIGPMEFAILPNSARIYLPTWIEVTTVDGAFKSRIWFSADDFQGQYNEYSVTLVPPVDSIDKLLVSTVAELNAVIQLQGSSYQVSRITSLTRDNVYTSINDVTFEWVSPSDPTKKASLTWVFLINGSGLSFDRQKELIKDAITSSTSSPGSWVATLPSLYGTNEFIVVPNWLSTSIAGNDEGSAFYSPVIKPNDFIAAAERYPGSIDIADIASNVEAVPILYRGLMLSVVSDPDSLEGSVSLKSKIPDYFPVSSGSVDFQRMSKSTQDWVLLMNRLAQFAEAYTDAGVLPGDIVAVTRGEDIFLSSSLNGVQYLMAPRDAYVNKVVI